MPKKRYLLILFCSSFSALFLTTSSAFAQSGIVKYVCTLDYPMGEKTEYLGWIKSIAGTLQEPDELLSIASYDNYFNASPNRFIEFKFDSMEDAIKYFDLPEVKEVIEMSTEKSVKHTIKVLRLRGDYYKSQNLINDE
jgi:hypothetical protein